MCVCVVKVFLGFLFCSSGNRSKLIVLITDGKPTDDPCKSAPGLKQAGIKIMVLAVGRFNGSAIKCLVTDSSDVIQVSSYEAFNSVLTVVEKFVCQGLSVFRKFDWLIDSFYNSLLNVDDINVVIDEVYINNNNAFVEIYNEGKAVNMKGFSLSGVINTQISSNFVVDQGAYAVIANYNVNCNGCPKLVVSDSKTRNRNSWNQDIKQGQKQLDKVQTTSTFPNVGSGKSCELRYPLYDNTLGDNWQQSCNNEGTPGAKSSSGCSTTCGSNQVARNGQCVNSVFLEILVKHFL